MKRHANGMYSQAAGKVDKQTGRVSEKKPTTHATEKRRVDEVADRLIRKHRAALDWLADK